MSDDLQPLLASPDVTDFERQLLRSWESERPSPGAREQTLAMLGLGAAAAGGSVLAASTSIAPKAIAAGWLAMAKLGAIGVVALSAIGAGTYAVTHRSGHDAAAHTVGVTVTSPAQTVVSPSAVETQTPVIELPSTAATHAVVRPAPPAASSLAQQVAAVDRARTALDGGEPARARRLVDAYEAEYPGGAFVQEAEVVRIDAFVREGNRSEAERAGKHFLAAYPKTPHAVRVRALLGYDP